MQEDCGGVAERNRGICGEAAGGTGLAPVGIPGPAESPRSPRSGCRRSEVRGGSCLTPQRPDSAGVCATLKLSRSVVDHVRNQQPRGGEEAAREYAERLKGLVPGVQKEISTCQGGKLRATSGEGTVNLPVPVRPSPSQPSSSPNFHLAFTCPGLRVSGLFHKRL